MKPTKTKCKYCDKFFCFKEDKLTIHGYGKVHIECYRNKLLEDYTEEYADNKIQELLKKEYEKNEQRKQKNTIRQLKDEKLKSKLDTDRINFENYIKFIYNTDLPKVLYIKLSKIVNGTYKGLKQGISYEDLLYMFKSKQQLLDKTYQQNIAKGMEFKNSIDRLNYDIAIIINKYDSYKKWKEKQRIIQSEINNQIKKDKEEIKIDYSKINNKNENDDVNIIDILDDIY